MNNLGSSVQPVISPRGGERPFSATGGDDDRLDTRAYEQLNLYRVVNHGRIDLHRLTIETSDIDVLCIISFIVSGLIVCCVAIATHGDSPL